MYDYLQTPYASRVVVHKINYFASTWDFSSLMCPNTGASYPVPDTAPAMTITPATSSIFLLVSAPPPPPASPLPPLPITVNAPTVL